MIAFQGWRRSILLLLVLMTLSSCALTGNLTKTKQGPEVYYTVPPVTYVREFPGYASRNVGTVYHGEQVTVLSQIEDEDWCRVQTSAGQQGWIQRALLSPVPLQAEIFFVQASAVPLRPEPHQEVISRQMLPRGAKVIKLAEDKQGWLRVLVEKDKSLGWLPADSVAPHPPAAAAAPAQPSEKGAAEKASSTAPGPKQLFVAVNSLELHLLPLFSSEVVKVLQFNDKVQEISQSGPKWRKVKFPETGVQGWTLASYLAESAQTAPKAASGRKKKAPSSLRRRGPKTKPSPQPEDLDPEVM